MTTVVLRLLITAWILATLARASHAAWRHRRLTLLVWRRIRWRHVLGSVGLLAVVGTIVTTLLVRVPAMSVGLGTLVGSSGNAVFIPLEEAVSRSGPAPAAGPDWVLLLLATVFLGALVALFPWLAFIEEEVFRAGLEDASWRREVATALVFGAAHLVMLVPVAAALAIAVAGFVYGRVYRAAYARADGDGVASVAVAAYRPTRRARAAAARARARAGGAPGGAHGVPGATPPDAPERRQAEAVVASTVWHTAFNTTVVAVVWLAIAVTAVG